jgi:2,4-dienoyl-CoA reductase-like NADH-dependent reductase (Old Yellow Enzyme family)
MPGLFDTFTLKSVTLRNRIGVSPMCQYSAIDGVPNDWHLVHLGSRAVGGAALVIAEATGVSPEGRISPGCTGLWNDAQTESWSRIAAFIAQHGAVPGIQIAHAGRKASAQRPWDGDRSLTQEEGAWPTLGPSALAFGGGLTQVPTAMTVDDIARVRHAFADAAKRALAAGFKWLELHYAHGYLAHSFLSPLSNKRDDAYGGSFDNRTRFAVETARAVRDVWPQELPLTVRLSCSDWIEGGWTIDESVALAQRLKSDGVDLIDCSSGGSSPDRVAMPVGPSWQVPFADRIRREAQIATAAVGLVIDPAQADDIVRSGRADLVLLARELLRDPYWPAHAAERLKRKGPSALTIQYRHWIG